MRSILTRTVLVSSLAGSQFGSPSPSRSPGTGSSATAGSRLPRRYSWRRSACAGPPVALLTLAMAFAILADRFYRDPDRALPDVDGDVGIGPADAAIIYVRHSDDGVLSSTKKGRGYELVELTKTPLREPAAYVTGIAMSFLDVHVNRAPIAGTVLCARTSRDRASRSAGGSASSGLARRSTSCCRSVPASRSTSAGRPRAGGCSVLAQLGGDRSEPTIRTIGRLEPVSPADLPPPSTDGDARPQGH